MDFTKIKACPPDSASDKDTYFLLGEDCLVIRKYNVSRLDYGPISVAQDKMPGGESVIFFDKPFYGNIALFVYDENETGASSDCDDIRVTIGHEEYDHAINHGYMLIGGPFEEGCRITLSKTPETTPADETPSADTDPVTAPEASRKTDTISTVNDISDKDYLESPIAGSVILSDTYEKYETSVSGDDLSVTVEEEPEEPFEETVSEAPEDILSVTVEEETEEIPAETAEEETAEAPVADVEKETAETPAEIAEEETAEAPVADVEKETTETSVATAEEVSEEDDNTTVETDIEENSEEIEKNVNSADYDLEPAADDEVPDETEAVGDETQDEPEPIGDETQDDLEAIEDEVQDEPEPIEDEIPDELEDDITEEPDTEEPVTGTYIIDEPEDSTDTPAGVAFSASFEEARVFFSEKKQRYVLKIVDGTGAHAVLTDGTEVFARAGSTAFKGYRMRTPKGEYDLVVMRENSLTESAKNCHAYMRTLGSFLGDCCYCVDIAHPEKKGTHGVKSGSDNIDIETGYKWGLISPNTYEFELEDGFYNVSTIISAPDGSLYSNQELKKCTKGYFTLESGEGTFTHISITAADNVISEYGTYMPQTGQSKVKEAAYLYIPEPVIIKTEEPVVSEEPEVSEILEESEAPGEPKISDVPAVSEEPAPSEEPAAYETPTASVETSELEVSELPEESPEPEVSAVPEESPEPEASAVPEESPEPEISMMPEVPVTPEAASVPEIPAATEEPQPAPSITEPQFEHIGSTAERSNVQPVITEPQFEHIAAVSSTISTGIEKNAENVNEFVFSPLTESVEAVSQADSADNTDVGPTGVEKEQTPEDKTPVTVVPRNPEATPHIKVTTYSAPPAAPRKENARHMVDQLKTKKTKSAATAVGLAAGAAIIGGIIKALTGKKR